MKTPTKPDDLMSTSLGVTPGGETHGQTISPPTSQIGKTIAVQDKNRVLAQLQSLGAPMGVQIIEDNTIDARFAVNLQNIRKPLLYINWTMCVETMKSTPTEMLIGLSHEINHVWEEAWRRSTPEGEKQYQEHLAHLKSKGRLWKSYHTLYNCLRDVWVNDMTIRRFQGRRQELGSLYRYKLFQGNDFTRYPKHLQFCYTLLRESPLHVPDEVCIIDPEVRGMIDIIQKSGLTQSSTFMQATKVGSDNLNPYNNLGDRIQIIRQYIESWFEELLNQDLEDRDNKDTDDKSDGTGDKNQDKSDGTGDKNQDKSDGTGDKNQDKSDGTGDKNQDKSDGTGDKNQDKSDGTGDKNQDKSDGTGDKNPWESLLDDGQLGHGLQDTLSPEDFQQFVQSLNDKAKDMMAQELDPDKDLKHLARQKADKKPEFQNLADDDPKRLEYINALYEYLKFQRYHVETVIDPVTGQHLINSMVDVFNQIISDRSEHEPIAYDGPVSINDNPHGIDLNNLADGISRLKAGNMNARLFTTFKDEVVIKQQVGVIDLYGIFDGSVSMNQDNKLYYQKVLGVALIEALAIANHNLKTILGSTEHQLVCNHYYSIFHGNSVFNLKSYSSELNDDERLTIFSGLSKTSGSTGDFKAVDQVTQLYQSLSDGHKQELEGGTRKSIVFIVTDGGSDDTVQLQQATKTAREAGLVLVGIGVGSDGKCVEDNYHSNDRTQGTGVHCPQPSLLPTTAIHALKPHIESTR